MPQYTVIIVREPEVGNDAPILRLLNDSTKWGKKKPPIKWRIVTDEGECPIDETMLVRPVHRDLAEALIKMWEHNAHFQLSWNAGSDIVELDPFTHKPLKR